MSSLEKNKQYIVTIEGYSSEAFGIARLEGKAVFIPGTLYGEIWE
ncbi:MAG: TRAM domain-containing protein, partial [Clostridiales bacterium]|nr:TRAM domain-containing protein [Clostridiales bacterium]